MKTVTVTKKYESDGKSAERSRDAINFDENNLQEVFAYTPDKDNKFVSVNFSLTDDDKKNGVTQVNKLIRFINSENERQAGILAYQEARFVLKGDDTVIESETNRIMKFAAQLGKPVSREVARERAVKLVNDIKAENV